MQRDSSQEPQAWQKAVRWLKVRDRSASEIKARLTAAGFSRSIVDQTLRRLATAGYVDDRRYANQVAEALRRRGCGSERVRATLTAAGVDDALIDSTAASVFADERQHAETVLAKRFGEIPSLPSERARAARFLARRGFPEDLVLAILG